MDIRPTMQAAMQAAPTAAPHQRQRQRQRQRAHQQPALAMEPAQEWLLEQVLTRLDDMSEAVARCATKEDLSIYVRRDVYEPYHQQVVNDTRVNSERISHIENRLDQQYGVLLTKLERLAEDFHNYQLADVRQTTQVAAGAEREIGAVRYSMQHGLAGAARQSSDYMTKLLFALLGFLGSGFVTLLVYVATHH